MSVEQVKSAKRVFEFLEYFARVQRAVGVAEIARHYGYPNSSVSTVMRTMAQLGYLAYDGRARTYLPTARLPFLVDWIATQLYDQEGVRAVMGELSRATGETILLGVQNGNRVQYVQVVEATGPFRLLAEPGSYRGLASTAVGHILLSRLPDATVDRIVRRINADEPRPYPLHRPRGPAASAAAIAGPRLRPLDRRRGGGRRGSGHAAAASLRPYAARARHLEP